MDEVRHLRCENAELRRVNGIFKAPSAFFTTKLNLNQHREEGTMDRSDIEALYMTRDEVAARLGVNIRRVYALRNTGMLVDMKGGVYSREEVEAYLLKRGDKRGGRYPKDA
jgi:hypothetical protein